MSGWWVIARRELLERVRSRWFLVTTLLGPLLLVAAMTIPVLIASAGGSGGGRIVIIDEGAGEGAREGSGLGLRLGNDLNALGWRVSVARPGTSDAELLQRVAADEIDGFLRLPAGLLSGQGQTTYQGDNASNQTAMAIIAARLQHNVTAVRLTRNGLASPDIQAALQPPSFEARHTTGRAEGASGALVFVLGYLIVMMLYMAIIIYAVNVMRAVVAEKTNKVIEVLLAAAKPHALMIGKIVGVGVTGLMQVALWATVMLVLSSVGPGLFGAAALTLPPVGPGTVLVIVAYFVLGYFLFAALYAAIGAMVSSDQEAQQAQGPIVILLIIPIACIQLVADDPRGQTAEILTQIPFTSPFLMPLRYLLDGASLWSVLSSLAILALSIALLTLVATRIFRVGILMTGKRPSLRELWHWVRHP